MLTAMAGILLIFFGILQVSEEVIQPDNTVHFWHQTAAGPIYEDGLVVTPVADFKYNNVVRQAYDYTCGAAALTTILDYYLGRQFDERQIMDGLLRFGETQKIIERKAFSLLDMKRLTTALGHPSGGFKATFEDIVELDHPAIVQMVYGGFQHFVVLKDYKDGHVFVADPALGNISFTEERFKDVWGGTNGGYRETGSGILFIVFPNGFKPYDGLAVTEDDLRVVDEQTINALAFTNSEYLHFYNNQLLENEVDRVASMVSMVVSESDFDSIEQFDSFYQGVGGSLIQKPQLVDGEWKGEHRAVYSTSERQFGKNN